MGTCCGLKVWSSALFRTLQLHVVNKLHISLLSQNYNEASYSLGTFATVYGVLLLHCLCSELEFHILSRLCLVGDFLMILS